MEQGLVVAPYVFDGLQAKLAETAGFGAVYMGGFGTAAARGYPDLGLLTMSEMLDNVRVLTRTVGVPVICDADTGYGNPMNVARTVREYERAGAAALHLEDQVWPKRCGYLSGKQVVELDEMVDKVAAACAARSPGGVLIIARSDALEAKGWDEVERRLRAYHEAGADLVFADGMHDLADLRTYARRLADLPLVYNGHLAARAEVAELGFRLHLHSGTLVAVYRAARDAMDKLQHDGAVSSDVDTTVFREIAELLGASRFLSDAGKQRR